MTCKFEIFSNSSNLPKTECWALRPKRDLTNIPIFLILYYFPRVSLLRQFDQNLHTRIYKLLNYV